MYDSDQEALQLDGVNDYIDIGTIGNTVTITNEHTIVVRALRESGGNYGTQSLFNATERGSPYEAHELYIERNTGKIGRYWNRIGNPMIVESGNNISI